MGCFYMISISITPYWFGNLLYKKLNIDYFYYIKVSLKLWQMLLFNNLIEGTLHVKVWAEIVNMCNY
jgi:hypothetical protein